MKTKQETISTPTIEEKLKSDLLFWQERLRLRDWDIQLIVSMTVQKMGTCRKLSDYKAAEIEIMHPTAIPHHWLCCKDPEVTLVHELLHLQGETRDDFIGTNERWKDHQERVIELTAIALVRLRREAHS